MSSLTTPIQYRTGSSSQSNQVRKRNKGYSNRKGGRQIFSICRRHDSISRRPHRLSPKSPETDKQLQQSLSIQNQCAKNHKHFYTPITDREPNQGRTAIHNCYKENKIPRNTTNKECKGPLQGELQTTV